MDNARITQCQTEAVRSGAFPGAELLVGRASDGDVLFHHAVGLAQKFPTEEPLSTSTIFDVASVTKAVLTTTLVMQAVAEHRLNLDSRVAAFLPLFVGPQKELVTVWHLLSHASGLPAWRPFFEAHRREPPAAARDAIRAAVAQEPLETRPGTRALYSDLSMILLGWIVETIGGERLDALGEKKIFAPLQLHNTFHAPTDAPLPRPASAFAATENCPWRKQVLRGRVHDDNCYVMGGVSGHAGLFSTTQDLFDFARALLRGQIVPRDIVDLFWTRSGVPGSDRALGWDTKSAQGSQAGSKISPGSVGHTGFTGTSLWIDRTRDVIVVLLTNRVHPRRDNELIKLWRPTIHDVVFSSL
ncbi:MAG: beta-lactamase family protein [Deltaproteobacteria bacterium]|nr:beta-lactamase family protein [Deltaproteobacteria bacterium]